MGLAAALAATAAGCGGGSNASGEQVAAITHTFNAYIVAVQKGDGKTACALLTPAYQKRAAQLATPSLKANVKGASCVKAISQGTLPLLKKFHPTLERVQVNGNHASGFQPGQGIFQPHKTLLVLVNGDWKISNTIYVRQPPKSSG